MATMSFFRLATLAATLALAPSVQAQTATPAKPTAPAVAQPQRPTAPTVPQAQKFNLNTASAADLDHLPQIGAARAKVIVDNRTAKGRFKNWDDFVTRMKGSSVNQTALDAIKDKVSF